MLQDCSRLASRMPECITTIWHTGLEKLANPSDPLWRVHTAWLKLVDLHSDVMNNRKAPTKVLPEALCIDEDLSRAFEKSSEHWKLSELPFPDSFTAPGLPNYAHFYQSSLSAQIWNGLRSGRLILHSLILKTLRQTSLLAPDSVNSQAREQNRRSLDIVRLMKMDILASLPQYLGLLPVSDDFEGAAGTISCSISYTASKPLERCFPLLPSISVSSVLTLQSDRLPVLRTARGYTLVWALALIWKLTDREDLLRQTACSCLRQLGTQLGVQQAFAIADALEREGDLTRA